jgi:hypothetical protein
MKTSSDPSEIRNQAAAVSGSRSDPARQREEDAIYQNGQVVAHVLHTEIDTQAKQIRFQELYNSDDLLLPDECEFRKYVIMVQRIGYASKVEKTALHKGRVMRQVVAEILGYREQ